MHRLFALPKISVFLDAYAPGVEKRRGEDVSIITMRCRVQPFNAQLATALDEGVGGDSNVRTGVFAHSTAPKPHFTRHDFTLPLDSRQLLTLYASSDTEVSRIAIDQVRIFGTYVRTQKDVDMLALIFKASFGPVSREELEYVHAWVRGQRSVTFTETENSLDFDEDDGDNDDEDDEDDKETQPLLPEPMFEDPRDERPPLDTAPPKTKRSTAH